MNNKEDKLIKKYIQAWYYRTLEVIDMDNGDKIIPPISEKEWIESVEKDLKKFINSHYISRDKVEGLKVKYCYTFASKDINIGYNQAVDEINQKIEGVLK